MPKSISSLFCRPPNGFIFIVGKFSPCYTKLMQILPQSVMIINHNFRQIKKNAEAAGVAIVFGFV